MEATRAEKARLGMFLIFTVSALVLCVFFMIGRKLTTKSDPYFTRISESVTGLETGSPVKQNGVDIGEISSINTDRTDVQKSIVHFRVTRGTPMKTDMTATLGSYGITGLKYLEITGGNYESPDIPRGGEVNSSLSTLGRLTQRADSIADKMDRLMGNVIAITDDQNQHYWRQLLQSTASLTASLDTVTRQIQNVQPGRRVQNILVNAEVTTSDLRQQIQHADLDSTVRDYRQVALDVQKITQTLDITTRNTQEELNSILNSIKESLDNMNTFSREIKDNPAVLLRGEEKQERHR
jgi:phospholipid/cholesterol/gamma-HCH transport system substrate-binding protein